MYTFKLTDKFLSNEEKEVFEDHLKFHGLDNSIWNVFSSLFRSGVKNTKPVLLKVYQDSNLCGAAIVIKCSHYGRSLFNNKLLAGITDLANVPFYLWIKFGCCMDMMSNPGFVKDPEKSEEVFKAIVNHLRGISLLTIINDYSENSGLYGKATMLPALPHAIIDCSNMTTVNDYTINHKNLKKKMRVFKNKGGMYNQVDNQLNKDQVSSLKKCFLSTSENSIFYLPYQDLYLSAAMNTSSTAIDKVYYFVATMNGEFLGYQAAIKIGNSLNALHGAFDRSQRTTYHAYDILFVKMTEFAIANGLNTIDFGAVLNFTKQKMINKSIEMSYFIFSKFTLVQWVLSMLLKLTKIQSNEQLKFRNI